MNGAASEKLECERPAERADVSAAHPDGCKQADAPDPLRELEAVVRRVRESAVDYASATYDLARTSILQGLLRAAFLALAALLVLAGALVGVVLLLIGLSQGVSRMLGTRQAGARHRQTHRVEGGCEFARGA